MTFVKGQSGNPNGRPPGTFSIVAMIKDKLKEVPEGQKETYAELVVKKYLHKALVEGDDKMLRDLVDRIDGKAVQKLIGDMDNPLINPNIAIRFIEPKDHGNTDSLPGSIQTN